MPSIIQMHYSQSLRQNIYIGDEAMSFEQNCSPRSQSIRKDENSDYIVSQLQREIDELSVHERDCDTLHEEIRQMEQRISDLNTELIEQATFYRTERESSLFKIARSQAQLRQQQKKHSEVEKEFKKYLFDNQDAEMVMKNRHHKFVESTETLKDVTLNYKNIKDGADRLRKEAHKMAQDKMKLRSTIEKTEEQLNAKLCDFKFIKERLTELQNKSSNYSDLLSRVQSENQSLAKEEAALERKLEETENQIFSFSIDLNNLTNEVQKCKNESFGLRAEMITLENKIAKRSEALIESDNLLVDLEKVVEAERAAIEKKMEFLSHLKEQQKDKDDHLSSKRNDIESYRFKCDLLKKFSQRAFDDLKQYVKLDRTVRDHFVRAYYGESQFKNLGESQTLRPSALKSY